MKTRVLLSRLSLIAIALTGTLSTSASVLIDTINPTVFILLAPKDDGKFDMYTIKEDNKEALLVFTEKEAATKYSSQFPDSIGRSFSATPWQRSFVETYVRNGNKAILDPTNAGANGEYIVLTGPDNEELRLLFKEDQKDRVPSEGVSINWSAVTEHDESRRARVMELYHQGAIRTGSDYFRAAMILHHGQSVEDILLAHEFSIVAIGKGHETAKWLAAATEDRFLLRIGRKQRFGTQRVKPLEVEGGVTDGLRATLGVPPLEAANERVNAENKAR